MAIYSLDDVITSLDAIVKECAAEGNTNGYFASLYRRMTMAVKDGVTNGFFENAERMVRLDVIFASRYIEAFHAYSRKQPCTTSWQFAFDGRKNHSLTVIQRLLLGINTHINLDLAVAAAVAAPGKKYMSSNRIFIKTTMSSLLYLMMCSVVSNLFGFQ